MIEGKLNVGEEYTLHEETAPGGFNVVSDFTFKVDKDNKVTLVNVTTEGEVEVAADGTLVVTDTKKKEVTVTVSKQDVADEEIAGAKIQIKDRNGKVVEEWTSGSDGKNEDGSLKAHVITGKLYADEEYTLHEEAGPAGYTTVTDIKFTVDEENKVTLKGTTTNGDVKVAEDGSIVITDKKTTVTVSKQDIGSKEIAGAKIQIKDSTGKVVEEWTSGSDGTNEDGSLKAHVIEGKLNVGEEYTLHEAAGPVGYNTVSDFIFKVDNDNKVTLVNAMTDGEVKVAEDGTLVVTDSKKEIGDLELTKTIKGDINEEEAAGALTFQIVSEDGKYLTADSKLVDEETTLTLEAFEHVEGTKVYTLKIENVDLGNYTVTETTKDISGKEYTVKYAVNGGAQTEGNEAAAAVEANKTTKVDFEDDYKNIEKTGNLELTKTIKGEITKEELEGALTFVIKTEDGKYLKANKTLTENANEAVLTLKDFTEVEEAKKYTLTLEGIDLGNYTVTETTKDITGKEYTVKYAVNGGDQKDGKEAKAEVKDGETTKVDFEDNYTKQTGKIELTKTIKGDINEEEAAGALTFQIVSEDGKYLTADSKLVDEETTLTLEAFEHVEGTKVYTLKIENVDLGNYTVTETTKDISGKEYTVKYAVNGGAQTEGNEAAAAVEANKTTKVDFEDDYKNIEKTGNLELTKTIKGEITKEELEGALTFVIKTEDGKYLKANKTLTENANEAVLTLKDFTEVEEAKKYTLTLEGIDLGNYTVTETTKDITGKEYTVKYAVNGGDQKDGKEAKAEVKDGETTKVDFEDNYTNVTEEKGNLIITKTVDGDNITESEFNGALKFTVQNADGKYLDADGKLSDAKVELTMKDGGFDKGEDGKYTKTFKDVKPGKYTVTETNSDVAGYNLVKDQSTTNGEATVENGKTATIELKDVYEKKDQPAGEFGELELVAEIRGNVTKEEVEKALTFEVKTEDGKWLKPDGTLSETKAEITLKDGFITRDGGKTYRKVFGAVPIGKYTIIQTTSNIEGHKFEDDKSVTTSTVTVENGKTATLTIEDEYAEEESKPAKEEESKEEPKTYSIKVRRISDDDETGIPGAKIQLLDEDGNVVEEWNSNETDKEITGLKPGVVYTIHEEETPDGRKPAKDTTIVLNPDGTINEEKTTTRVAKDGTLLIEDAADDDSKEKSDDSKSKDDKKKSSSGGSSSGSSVQSPKSGSGSSVKTGDESNVEFYWMSGITAFAVLLLLLREKKKKVN